MGSAVTATGRAVIEHTKEVVEKEGQEVVYGDTDSTLVELGGGTLDELVERGEALEERINESYDSFAAEEFNADEHRWEIEFEKLYERFFQAGRKKRYAGKLVWKEGKKLDEADLDITGFEYKRSDVAGVTKEVQQEVIEMILNGAGFDKVSEYIQDVVARFKEGEYGYDEMGVPGGIGQKLESYDTDTAQVKGAKYANEHLGTNFTSGSKPKRLYVKRVKGDLPPTEVVCFEYPKQVPDEIEIDTEKMLEKTVRNPIERILEALGWSWSEVVNGQRQQGLGSFT
jgi:DNA polymerase elongation subunit (family B)